MKKNLSWMLSLCAGLVMPVLSAGAADGSADLPQMEVSRSGAAVTQVQMPIDPQFKLSEMSVLLEGALYPMAAMSQFEGQVSIIVDEESLRTGVARAYRTHEEFDAYVAANKKSCSGSNESLLDTTSQCFFYDNTNCTGWTRRLAVNCGYAATNLTGLLTVRSLSLGCGTTFACPTADCSGTCAAATGPAGTCVNITSGTVQCAGCVN